MKKHNFFVNFLKKVNIFINSLLEKKLNKLNFLFEADKLLIFFNFKRIIGFLIILLFVIFSYLFIPYIYNGNKLATKIQNQLFTDLGINLNLSNNFTYNLFPKPNFVFQEIEFINETKKFADIKEMKTYVSFKNLFSINKINIEKIVLNKANFDLNKNNYKFFTNILNKNLSNFNFNINNSSIIFKNIENDVLFINKINELEYFYDNKNLENVLLTENEIFNIPYKIKVTEDSIKEKIITKINLDLVNLEIENSFNYSSNKKNGLIKLIHNQNKSEGNYKFEKNFFNFNYLDQSQDQNYKYNGFVSLKPFFSEFSGDLGKLNSDMLLNSNSIMFQLLKTGILNNKNLNISTRINAKQISSFRDLVNLSLNAKISEGLVDINQTKFELKNYAEFKITDSLIYTDNNNLILDALISINIKDVNEVYKIFQTPLKNRKKIKKIEFNLSYNFDQQTANLNTIKVNDVINKDINETLKQLIFKDNLLQNRIYLKNLANKAIKNYSG